MTNTTETEALPKFERGPLQTFEVVWLDDSSWRRAVGLRGHVELVEAHEVHFDRGGSSNSESIRFYGMFDGKWTMVLHVAASQLRSVRNLTHAERARD